MRKHLLFPVALAISFVLFTRSAGACVTDAYSRQFNHFNDTFRNSLILDFNDYGLIFEDAKTPECSALAREALIRKIGTTGWHYDAFGRWVGPFMGWLEGNQVALIYASGLMIGGNGDLNQTLDDRLQSIRGSYAYNQSPGCGWDIPGWSNHGDTCMEEHAAAAAAYAWMAAYVSKRLGWWYASSHVSYANSHIDAALSTADSICISDPNEQMAPYGRGPCNVDRYDPDDGHYLTQEEWMAKLTDKLTPEANGHTKADVYSFNRSENIVYGAGQLTILNAALIGLEEASYGRNLRDDQQLIAAALVEEAQRKSDSGGNWFKGSEFAPSGTGTCADASVVNGAVVRNNDVAGCADGKARPRIFNLNTRAGRGSPYSSFWEHYLYSQTPRTVVVDHWIKDGQHNYSQQSAYQFNEFDDSLFSGDASEGNLGPGRKVIYKNLGWTWSTIDPRRYNENVPWQPIGDSRPRLTAYLDENEPYGWLDGIIDYGSLGAAVYGWACDRDRPTFAIKVQIRVDGMTVGEGWASYDSEPQVNYECGGGSAHRYAIAIPPWTKGHWVQAWGIDATWKGETLLAAYNCGQLYACTW